MIRSKYRRVPNGNYAEILIEGGAQRFAFNAELFRDSVGARNPCRERERGAIRRAVVTIPTGETTASGGLVLKN